MDLKYLDYVITVAKEKNISRAAEKLFVSQPTLSQYIQKLEQNLGIPLFNRNNKNITLTAAGKAYIESAKKILNINRQTDLLLSDFSACKKGLLSLGIPNTIGVIILPRILPKFHKLYPDVSFTITERNSSELLQLTERRQIDIAIVQQSDKANTLIFEPLYADEFLLVVPKEHIIAQTVPPSSDCKYPKISLSLCENEQFIILKEGFTRQKIYNLFNKANVFPKKIIEIRNMQTAHLMASEGLGLTFVTESLVKSSPEIAKTLRYYSVEEPENIWTMSLAYHKDCYMANIILDLIKVLKEETSIFTQVT
ncbi:MAG: LysR family transcriptional regulator [Clostridia bacterium]